MRKWWQYLDWITCWDWQIFILVFVLLWELLCISLTCFNSTRIKIKCSCVFQWIYIWVQKNLHILLCKYILIYTSLSSSFAYWVIVYDEYTIKHYILIFYSSAFRNNRRQTSFFHGHSRILYSVLTSTFLNSSAKNDSNSSIFLDLLIQLDILDRVDIKRMQFSPLYT